MGKSFKVETTELEKVSRQLQECSDNYKRLYEQIFEKVATMGEAWKGDDNIKFVDQINGFCKEMQDMATKLSVASQTLHQIKQNYEDHVQRNVQAASKLSN